LRDGKKLSEIVQAMVDSEKFTFMEIQEALSLVGHRVVLTGDEHRGEMLITPLEDGAPTTTLHWGGYGTSSENEIRFRNSPEEILVGDLKKKGFPIKTIVAKLVEIGLTASELRTLFNRLGYRVYGGGYGEPEGWMLIGNPADEPSEESLARVHWGKSEDSSEEQESFAVSWSE
ncbi:MAG: hypothetical protein Q8P56_05885, partial [Candidatus Uhrbacteria bacterium]|nr:hypothetical protein [Candidatus Uhrbacteria bacterium]